MNKKPVNYHTYIHSEQWRKKRLKRLKMDGFRCQFRVGKLQCTAKTHLEVHHLSYKNLGNERFKELITLCRLHHKRIHKQRG
jgi:hypothetical protein